MRIMTRLAGALLCGVTLAPALAAAQPLQGLYVSGGAGANLAGDLQSTQQNTKVYTTLGPVGLVDLGWGFGNGLRAEIEGSYRANSISGISTLRGNGSLEPLTNVGGNAATYAVMANVAYDIPLHPFGLPLQPYIGAGAGYGWLDMGNANGDGFGTLPGTDPVPIISPPVPIVSPPFPVISSPLPVISFPFPVSSSLVPIVRSPVPVTSPATPVVPSLPAPTIVSPQPSTVTGPTRVTFGSARYNQALSLRRADAVAAELVKDGVPKSAISIQGFGETHLLVPTGAGVREPQNRRVEIVIL